MFQRFYRERLGLVNNQDGSLSLSINRKEVLVYKSDQRWEIKAAGIWFQVRSEFSQEIQNKSFGSLLGIQNERDLNIGGRLFKEAANQSRFPGSDLPGELDKPPFFPYYDDDGFFGPGPIGYGYFGPYGYDYSYPVAVLVIDVLDAKNHRLIWRGWVSRGIRQSNFSAAAIYRDVNRILAHFPPR